MTLSDSLSLLAFVLACVVVASSGAIFKPGQWYKRLDKPAWRPPDWLFGPAWAVLYAMIAVSGWLVWRTAGFEGAALGFAFYVAQLVLNGIWSGLFFGLRRPGLALIEMALMWLAILGNIVTFYPVHAGAAYLLVPYLAWVSFAFALNLSIWRRNPQAQAA